MIREKRRVDCDRCKGSGEISPDPRDPMSPWFDCSACGGEGYRLAEPPSASDARREAAERLERIARNEEPLPF